MPFGLRNAALTFQKFIDQVLCRVSSAYTYINDVLLTSSNPEQHLQYFLTAFDSLQCMVLSLIPISAYLVAQNLIFSVITLIDRVESSSCSRFSSTPVSERIASVYWTYELLPPFSSSLSYPDATSACSPVLNKAEVSDCHLD